MDKQTDKQTELLYQLSRVSVLICDKNATP